MKCTIKSLLLSIFALFAVLFGSCIITSKSVSAVADFTTTWDYDSHPPLVLCGADSGRSCSDFSYVIFHPLSSCSGNAASFYVSGLGSFSGNSLISVCSDIIAPINTSYVLITGGVYLDTRYSGFVDITLTDSLGSSCPVCPICPEVPENPYDPKFDEIKQAILIIPATALVIYFFFCIYRMLLKGRE